MSINVINMDTDYNNFKGENKLFNILLKNKLDESYTIIRQKEVNVKSKINQLDKIFEKYCIKINLINQIEPLFDKTEIYEYLSDFNTKVDYCLCDKNHNDIYYIEYDGKYHFNVNNLTDIKRFFKEILFLEKYKKKIVRILDKNSYITRDCPIKAFEQNIQQLLINLKNNNINNTYLFDHYINLSQQLSIRIQTCLEANNNYYQDGKSDIFNNVKNMFYGGLIALMGLYFYTHTQIQGNKK